jgi:hypothetical protein
MLKFAAILGLPLSLLVAGCGDTTTNAPADMTASASVPHNFAQISAQFLTPGCAGFSVCHSPEGARDANMLNLGPKNLDGSANDPYVALVGVAAVNAKAHGEGKLRVKPCDSTDSFLTIKLTMPKGEDPITGYGDYMPSTNPHLPAEQIQAIKDWIDRGALRDEPATVTGKTCTLGADMATAAHD